ncbi:unnamed protein product, partial [Ectocarpus sp. 12 AP-2014]
SAKGLLLVANTGPPQQGVQDSGFGGRRLRARPSSKRREERQQRYTADVAGEKENTGGAVLLNARYHRSAILEVNTREHAPAGLPLLARGAKTR